jgi:hypothetical protein
VDKSFLESTIDQIRDHLHSVNLGLSERSQVQFGFGKRDLAMHGVRRVVWVPAQGRFDDEVSSGYSACGAVDNAARFSPVYSDKQEVDAYIYGASFSDCKLIQYAVVASGYAVMGKALMPGDYSVLTEDPDTGGALLNGHSLIQMRFAFDFAVAREHTTLTELLGWEDPQCEIDYTL